MQRLFNFIRSNVRIFGAASMPLNREFRGSRVTRQQAAIPRARTSMLTIAAEELRHINYRALVDDISVGDVLKHKADTGNMLPIQGVRVMDSLETALHEMNTHNVTSLVLFDTPHYYASSSDFPQTSKVVGLLTVHDIAACVPRLYNLNNPMLSTCNDILTTVNERIQAHHESKRPTEACALYGVVYPETSLLDCLDVMVNSGLRRLLVSVWHGGHLHRAKDPLWPGHDKSANEPYMQPNHNFYAGNMYKYELVGILSFKDIATALLSVFEPLQTASLKVTVKEALGDHQRGSVFPFVEESTSLLDVARKFDEDNVGCLLVGSHQNSISGILTEWDLCKALNGTFTTGFRGRTAEDIMTKDIQCVSSQFTLIQALGMFAQTGHRFLPLVDASAEAEEDVDLQSRILGLISLHDVVAALHKHSDKHYWHLHETVIQTSSHGQHQPSGALPSRVPPKKPQKSRFFLETPK